MTRSSESTENSVDVHHDRNTDTSYRELLEEIPIGVVLHDPDDGAFVDMNSQYAEMFGYDRDECLEAGFEVVHANEPPYTVESARQRIREAVDRGPQTFEWLGARKDGSQLWTEVRLTPVEFDGFDRILAVVRNITERKEREAELREKSTILDTIFDRLPIHLYVKDEEARKVWVSSNYIDDPEAQIGKTDLELYPEVFSRQSYADDMEVIETGEPIIDREEYVEYVDKWHLTSKIPWYDDEGDVQGLVGVTWDITEMKEYEQELQRQNERLEEFVGVVSHDLRNPLQVAQGHLELAQRECESESLDAVENAHERMEALITDLLTLARNGRSVDETASVDLAELVDQCWRNVETPAATLVTDADRTIQADRGRLQQLLENLFRNAVEHGGANVTITVGDLDDCDGFYVADDGSGIPEGERDKTFESGYTTAEDGTGFGLSIVEQIAQAHDWEISVTNSDDGGARFEVTDVEFN